MRIEPVSAPRVARRDAFCYTAAPDRRTRRIDRMRVLAKPMPTELTTPINLEGNRKMSVEAHRNLFCSAYDDCLNEAVKRGWNSFTCVRCPNYSLVESPEHSIEAFATQRKSA
jgi:hypothetical protein